MLWQLAVGAGLKEAPPYPHRACRRSEVVFVAARVQRGRRAAAAGSVRPHGAAATRLPRGLLAQIFEQPRRCTGLSHS